MRTRQEDLWVGSTSAYLLPVGGVGRVGDGRLDRRPGGQIAQLEAQHRAETLHALLPDDPGGFGWDAFLNNYVAPKTSTGMSRDRWVSMAGAGLLPVSGVRRFGDSRLGRTPGGPATQLEAQPRAESSPLAAPLTPDTEGTRRRAFRIKQQMRLALASGDEARVRIQGQDRLRRAAGIV